MGLLPGVRRASTPSSHRADFARRSRTAVSFASPHGSPGCGDPTDADLMVELRVRSLGRGRRFQEVSSGTVSVRLS